MRAALTTAALAVTLAACSRSAAPPPPPATLRDWDSLLRQSRSSQVNFAMWAGDEERNRYFRERVTSAVKREFDIDLRVVPLGDTAEVINKLLNEKAAGKMAGGTVDIVWINGENFRTARHGAILWGPFSDLVPNVKYYDPKLAARDFGTPVEGWEVPWQRAQFVFAYDSLRVPDPPKSVEALGAWAKAHPGRFTYIAPPDFTGSAFVRHVLLQFADSSLEVFDEGVYRSASDKALRFLNEIKPFLWRKGETYPPTLRDLNRLFANNEVDFAMSYGPAFASLAIERGEFPPSTRTFVLDRGTIGNYNFLAIPYNAANPAGAVVVINHLLSPDRSLDMSENLRTPFPLDRQRLSATDRARADAIPRGPATLPDEVLSRHYMPEPDAEYLSRFEKDWIQKVLRR